MLSDQEQDFDLLDVVPGKWLFTPPEAPLKINVEWVHEGVYVQGYATDNLPFLPKDTALVRIHPETREAGHLFWGPLSSPEDASGSVGLSVGDNSKTTCSTRRRLPYGAVSREQADYCYRLVARQVATAPHSVPCVKWLYRLGLRETQDKKIGSPIETLNAFQASRRCQGK